MTIFSSTLPFKLVTRVWDAFLCDGWIIVYKTVIALLQSIQEELKKRDFEQILSYLRGFQPEVEAELICELSSKLPLEQWHVKDHATEFRRLTESGEMQVEEVFTYRFKTPESVDGYSTLSAATSRQSQHNIKKVHRFVSKLKRSTREITVENLSAKIAPVVGREKLVAVLYNVLSPEECLGIIKRGKGEQFEDVLVRRSGGNDVIDVASCRRSLIEDMDLATELFTRVSEALRGTDLEDKLLHAPWITAADENSVALNASGLNDRLHVLRYGVGQFFAPHRDSRFRRNTEISHITMQCYLNNNFSGGKTSFRGGKRFLDVTPKQGCVLLFDQDLRREECEVQKGRKFIIRADVMFDAA